jgi:aspartyl-tRNA(Asn)/glutamyl-tRNA(Gln) amidotransferase subunit C
MLSPEQVDRIALLARLEITDEEKALYAKQLSAVLAYADQLAQVNVDGIAPTATVLPVRSVMRPGDEAAPSMPRDLVLKNAPRTDGMSFEVPATLSDEE